MRALTRLVRELLIVPTISIQALRGRIPIEARPIKPRRWMAGVEAVMSVSMIFSVDVPAVACGITSEEMTTFRLSRSRLGGDPARLPNSYLPCRVPSSFRYLAKSECVALSKHSVAMMTPASSRAYAFMPSECPTSRRPAQYTATSVSTKRNQIETIRLLKMTRV